MNRRTGIFVYPLAVLLGLAAGILEITINDLLVTALFVMIATMVLGFVRPQRAWRWTLIIAVCVPLARLGAYFLLTQHSDRAQIWESAFGFLTGTAGAYAGVLGRMGVDTLFRAEREKGNSTTETRSHGETETRRN